MVGNICYERSTSKFNIYHDYMALERHKGEGFQIFMAWQAHGPPL